MLRQPEAVPKHLVVFAHGKESGPWGTKITHLAETARRRGFEVLSPDYSHSQDPGVRVQQLLELAPKARQTLVLVGSSMGGYVSLRASETLQPEALMLLAPALYFPNHEEDPAPPAVNAIVHGWDDDVVPAERAIRYARKHSATLHLLRAGHTLNDRLPELEKIFDDLLLKAQLAGAYRLARYAITAPNGEISRHIGRIDVLADARLKADCGVASEWAIVTACNPQGKQLDDGENVPRIAALRQRIDGAGVRRLFAAGYDPEGRWQAEASELLCDPPAGFAEALGREFGQNAIVRGRLGSAPELAWLR